MTVGSADAPIGCTDPALGGEASRLLGRPLTSPIAAHVGQCLACALEHRAFKRFGECDDGSAVGTGMTETSRPTNTQTPGAIGTFTMMAMAIGPDAFDVQIAQGQSEAVASETLPYPRDSKVRADYEALGFVFGEQFADDKLFCPVTMPAGWTKQRTSHGMHSNILDALGNRRGSFFYKSGFWDRDAILYNAVRRYRIEEYSIDSRDVYERNTVVRFCVVDRVRAVRLEDDLNEALEAQGRARGQWKEDQCKDAVAAIQARMLDAVLFTAEHRVDLPIPSERPSDPEQTKAHRAWWDRHDELKDQAVAECKAWLAANRPDHESPAAYWPDR
jgi:hypothetical protein